jgi:hypothetical protein
MNEHEVLLEELTTSIQKFSQKMLSEDDSILVQININGNVWGWFNDKFVLVRLGGNSGA